MVDRILLKLLGYDKDKIEEILDYLYPALANEIENLKQLMEG
jgi:hypothetical protein